MDSFIFHALAHYTSSFFFFPTFCFYNSRNSVIKSHPQCVYWCDVLISRDLWLFLGQFQPLKAYILSSMWYYLLFLDYFVTVFIKWTEYVLANRIRTIFLFVGISLKEIIGIFFTIWSARSCPGPTKKLHETRKTLKIARRIPNKHYWKENKIYHTGLEDWNQIPLTNVENSQGIG